MTTTQTESQAVTDAITAQAVRVPTNTADDGSSISLGYTESDPVGPDTQQPPTKLIAGKFKTHEDLINAYKELESKLGSSTKGQQKEQENMPQVTAIEHTEEATTLLQNNGLDIATFTQEFETTGVLSDQSYSTLESKGITRDMVDAYINGQRVMVESQINDIKQSVGGNEEYTKIAEWAAANLPQNERDAYDRILQTNDVSIITIAAQGLKARYVTAMGKTPDIVIAGNIPGRNDGTSRFDSLAEMTSAMKDPRYSTDSAYRAKVERKVINSHF